MPLRCPFLTWLITSCSEPLKCSDLNQKGKFCLWQNCNGLTIMVHVYIFIFLWRKYSELQERTKTVEVNFHKNLNIYFAVLRTCRVTCSVMRWAILITDEKSCQTERTSIAVLLTTLNFTRDCIFEQNHESMAHWWPQFSQE